MNAPFKIHNSTVVLTGGLGQLGRQFSRALLQQGARVAVLDCRAAPAKPSDFLGIRVPRNRYLCLEADVTRKASLEDALRCLPKSWGVPTGLINNAAVDAPPGSRPDAHGPLESFSEKEWDRTFETNAKGVFLSCQVIGGTMARSRQGSIINISSIYGMVSPDPRVYAYRKKTGKPFYKPAAYGASKASLLNLTRYLAVYWAGKVRVNTLTLGGVFNRQDKAFLKGYKARVPMGRMAREDEYNAAVIFLLSGASSYMTGSNLVIDGGWTAW